MMFKIALRLLLFSTLLALSACKKVKVDDAIVGTSSVDIGSNYATMSGVLYSEDPDNIAERGIFYSTKEVFGKDWIKKVSKDDSKNFKVNVQELFEKTKYYYRAYVLKNNVYYYGSISSFNTSYSPVTLLSLQASTVVSNSGTEFIVNTYQSTAASYSLVFCWSDQEYSSIISNSVVIGNEFYFQGPNQESYILKGIDNGKKYFCSVFAVGPNFIKRSNVVELTSLEEITLKYIEAGFVSVRAQVTTKNITSDTSVRVGICWSQTPGANIADEKMLLKPSNSPLTFYPKTLLANSDYYLKAFVKDRNRIIYSNEIYFRTLKGTLTDIEGNQYYTVELNGREWTTSNYRCTKFNDGSQLTVVSSINQWNSLSSFNSCCISYFIDANNDNTHGKLYSLKAVNSGKLAPPGWHVASMNDWQDIYSIEVNKLYSNNGYWVSPSYSNSFKPNNESNFSIQPYGYLDYYFSKSGEATFFWIYQSGQAYDAIEYDNSGFAPDFRSVSGNFGAYVRLVKDL